MEEGEEEEGEEEEEEEEEALTLSATQSVGHPLAVNIEQAEHPQPFVILLLFWWSFVLKNENAGRNLRGRYHMLWRGYY